jgi:hypothetical protein
LIKIPVSDPKESPFSMSGSFTVRLAAAIGIIAVCFGIVYLTSIHGIPHMVLPDWHLNSMPKQLGAWTWDGKKKELDPLLFNTIGAVEVEDREYRDPSGVTIVLHSALFDDSEKGLRHSPINCYRENGWTRISMDTVPMGSDPGSSGEICIILWEKKGEQCITGHWYQVGEDQVFDRGKGFMSLRLKRFGQSDWPPMVKVLLQISVTDQEKSSANLKDFGLQMFKWLSQLRKSS